MKKENIEKNLDTLHYHICKAGFLVVTMIVKRRLSANFLKDVHYHLSKAQEKLGEFNVRSNDSRM